MDAITNRLEAIATNKKQQGRMLIFKLQWDHNEVLAPTLVRPLVPEELIATIRREEPIHRFTEHMLKRGLHVNEQECSLRGCGVQSTLLQ